MLVQQLQAFLQERYDVSVPYAVSDFVSHDPALLRQLTGQSSFVSESLLVQQSPDNLDVTLYLDSNILDRANNLITGVDNSVHELDSLNAVVEGVSHALCLFWHAIHDRQIRPIDLELQAEIDKYLLLTRLLPNHHTALLEELFEHVKYHACEGSDLHQRYKTANDHASRYCRWLNATYMQEPDEAGLKSELARFYRLSGTDKLYRTQHFQGTLK